MAWADAKDLVTEKPTDREVRQVEDYIRRKAKPRFYADENFPTIATEILRRREADVLTVQEAGRRRHPDENHAAEALRLGRVLITCDRDYLDERRFPLIHCPAIVICDFGRGSVREIQGTFGCLWSVFAVPQFYDKWVKIDASHDCWKEHTRFLDGSTAHRRFRIFGGRLQEWCEAGVCA
jgi:predicted nuclease of predicted toxin-antitoxin system